MAKRRFNDLAEPDEVQPVSIAAAAPQITLREAFAKLAEANNLPEKTDSERKIKQTAVAKANSVAFKVQQGLPLVEMNADHIAKSSNAKPEDLRLTRLSYLARTNTDIAWLLNQYRTITAN